MTAQDQYMLMFLRMTPPYIQDLLARKNEPLPPMTTYGDLALFIARLYCQWADTMPSVYENTTPHFPTTEEWLVDH